MIWKHPMRSQSGVYWNNVVAKEFMYFRVSQAPSWYYGLVCAVCFQDLLQQLNVLLIYTYCTSRRRWVIYFWKQDSQSHRTTSKCHWSACRSSTLCAVSTSNLSNRWYSEYNFWLAALSLSCDGTMMSFIFQFVVLHLQLQGFSTSASPKKSGLCNQTLSPCGWGLGRRLYAIIPTLLPCYLLVCYPYTWWSVYDH